MSRFSYILGFALRGFAYIAFFFCIAFLLARVGWLIYHSLTKKGK